MEYVEKKEELDQSAVAQPKVTSKYLRDKILFVISTEKVPISGMSLKNRLSVWHGISSSKASYSRIDRMLKKLTEENRDDFGKLFNSYHGGKDSESYKNRSKLQKYNKVKEFTRKRMQAFQSQRI